MMYALPFFIPLTSRNYQDFRCWQVLKIFSQYKLRQRGAQAATNNGYIDKKVSRILAFDPGLYYTILSGMAE